MSDRTKAREGLARLFKRQPVADLATLRRVVGTTSRRTVSRTLSELGYLTSYSHAGRYYTLKNIPLFDEDGVWAHQGVLFSKYRTLRATTVQLVQNAPAGRTHAELQQRLQLRIHDTLRELAKAKKIGRVQLDRIFLYVSVEEAIARAQQDERRQLMEVRPQVVQLPSITVIIEVLLDVIHSAQAHSDPSTVAARLMAKGIDVSTEQVEEVFRHHGVEKKTVGSHSPLSRR